MKRILSFIVVLITAGTLRAQTIYPGGQSEIGTGNRAFALANNHTALSAGVADLYWNPAALSFSVTREVELSLYGIKLDNESDYFGRMHSDDLQRFHIGSAGLSVALPTSRGGMTIAGSYSNPVLLDDVFRFSGTSELDDTITGVERAYRVTGNLNYWTAGFGLQVAPNFGIGLATSLITGKGTADSYLDEEIFYPDGDTLPIYDNYIAEGRYIGYDLRVGLYYKTSIINAGLRLVVPQVIRYHDYASGIYDGYDIDGTDKYTMFAPYKGAIGISAVLPMLTVSAEMRLTLPYDYLFPVEKIPHTSQASRFKTGAGIGIEVPLVVVPLIVRAGYSFDDLDLHPYAYDFVSRPDNVKEFDWSDAGMKVSRDLNRISAGIGYITESMSFDLTYGMSTWGIATRTNLRQTYLLHRVLASVSVRF